MNCSQDQELEIFVNNVVSSFALGCSLNLRKIATEGAHVIYKRDQSVKIRTKLLFVVYFHVKILDGFDENSKPLLFSEYLVIGQSNSNWSNKVCVKKKPKERLKME